VSGVRQETLDALCRTLLPHAYEETDARADVVAATLRRIDSLDAHLRHELLRLFALLDNPLAMGALTARPLPFCDLSPAARGALLRRMETSRVPLLRTAFQALRRLVLSSYYSLPEGRASVGYLEPMPARPAAFPWEGPLAPERLGGDAAGPVAVGHPGDHAHDVRAAGAAGFARASANAGNARNGSHPPLRVHELPSSSLRVEAVVIGSGAGGAVAAALLAEAGREVAVLEAGRLWAPAELGVDEEELTRELYEEGAARATTDLAVTLLQGRAVGGSTLVNWMVMLRTPAYVLDEWVRRHGLDGFDASSMAPVFDEVERAVRAAPVPAVAHSPGNQLLLEGAARIGLDARPATINAHDCVRAGVCGLGCPYAAKQDAAQTWLPRAAAAGARVYERARVTRIEHHAGADHRLHVQRLDRGGRPIGEAIVETPLVLLAAGAIGTPLLLQRSALGGGAVGRWLRLHPTTAIGALHPGIVYGGAGIPLSVVARPRHPADWWLETPPMPPALAAAALPGFGAPHRRLMASYPRLATNIVLTRDGGGTDASQGDVRPDAHGRPLIRYRVGRRERAALREGTIAAARLQLAVGADEVRTLHVHGQPIRSEADLARIEGWPDGPNQLGVFSAHVMGSCRMGTDPHTSACGPDGALRGVSGIDVVDGSLLPSAPGVNPQETIMAVATVVTRRIIG